MSTPAQVVLVHTASAMPREGAAAHPLAQALRSLGASVRELPLAAPYDALLDAIEAGWLPVACKPTDDPPE
jgi:hypothetical protein